MRQRGVYLGQEFRGKGANIALGPVAGPLGRTPYSGRNWEGFSSDPYLTGAAMEETITGIQSTGVQACAKHWLANEQETQRTAGYDFLTGSTTTEAVSSNVDDRTLHELYAWPFYNAVRAGVATFMCSYNRVNQSYACQNSKMINGILKGEMGFQGAVMSDWGATHSGVAEILAGTDMDMPGLPLPVISPKAYWGSNIVKAVQNGSLAETRLDDMIYRIMTPYYYLGQDQPSYPTIDPSSASKNTLFELLEGPSPFVLSGPSSRDVRANHSVLIRELGAAGTVLLKNSNSALPLNNPKNIAVFGNDQGEPVEDFLNVAIGTQNWPDATIAVGGGSGSGSLSRLVAPLDAIKEKATATGSKVQSFPSNVISTIVADLKLLSPYPDVCLTFLKVWAEEGTDRTQLNADASGNDLVNSVASYCNNTVVVLHTPGQTNLPFSSHPNVTAILMAHYPGEETGHSIADVLWGDVNPSGRLPYTIARNESDYNAHITTTSEGGKDGWQSNFTEGLLIDYRYFDSIASGNGSTSDEVQYPFGYGLSYTSFDMSDLSVGSASSAAPEDTGSPLDELFTPYTNVSVFVMNTGSVPGAAIPQLYLSIPEPAAVAGASSGTPKRLLRGFDKVYLQPNQTQTVNFELLRRDVSYWDVVAQQWQLASGTVGVEVGWWVGDVRASGSIEMTRAFEACEGRVCSVQSSA